jgi:hypothetical protein
MKANQIFVRSFFLSIAIVILGALLKINHNEFANVFLVIGLLLTATYKISGILEVTNSNKIDQSKKILWIVGFIFFGFITGLVYILSTRKRIIIN